MRASSRLTDVSYPLAHAPASWATLTYFKFSVLVTRRWSLVDYRQYPLHSRSGKPRSDSKSIIHRHPLITSKFSALISVLRNSQLRTSVHTPRSPMQTDVLAQTLT